MKIDNCKLFTEKLKLIYQPDGISCGPTSLKMVSDYYGIICSIEELTIAMGTDNKTGTTDVKMKLGLEYLSLDYEQFSGGKDISYNKLYTALKNGNMILLRTLVKGIKHWICCDGYSETKKTFNILDPWLGNYELDVNGIENIWSPREYDGFIVKGISKKNITNFQILPITENDKHQIISMCSTIFSGLMSYNNNYNYIKSSTDFTKSVKLVVNDEIVGAYLIKEIILEGKIGLEGVALAIKPTYRKYGLGEKLKDWLENYAKDNKYAFIFGQHLKGLSNINYWLKRRELYSENEHSYYTIKWLNDKDK